MATREEKIAFIQAKLGESQGAQAPAAPSREQKLAFVKAKLLEQQAPQENKADAATVAGRNFVQGATLGFSDEFAGGVEAAGKVVGLDGLGGSFSDIKFSKDGFENPFGDKVAEAYRQGRDKERGNLKTDFEERPVLAGAANVVGAVVSPVGKLKALKNAGAITQGTGLGAITGAGASDGDLFQDPSQVLIDTGKGAAFGFGAGAVMKGAGAAVKGVGKRLGKFAEKTAENATGATGVQASKFEEGAGRQLLDRKLVRFGDNQAKIAGRLEKASQEANKQIDDALSALEAKGVQVDENKIIEGLQQKISKLKSDPSQADVAKLLEKEIENVVAAGQARGGSSIGIRTGEEIKRGYNRKAGNWMDPEKSQSGKSMYQAYRGAVEDAANAADPATAKLFEEGKKSYGLLRPIEEAAERRAMTTNQSPAGGFLDVTSGLGGLAAGGPVMAIAAPIARRVVAPRIASTVAVTADKASKGIAKLAAPADSQAARKAFGNSITYERSKGVAASKAAESDEPSVRPLKGNEKWANDGFNKAIEARPELSKFKGAMLSDPKTKAILISMSDATPGSKRFNAAMAELEQLGKAN